MNDAHRFSRSSSSEPAPVDSDPSDEQLSELRRRLTAAARRSCPRWMTDQVEDIVQTAMMRILSGTENRDGGIQGLPSSYVARAAYSAAVDEMRRRFRRGEVQEDPVEGLDGTPSPTPLPDRGAQAAEIHAGLHDCLGNLIRPRRIIVACRLQGYSVPETATFTGWTRKKVEHLALRGMEDLRHCLEAKGLKPGREVREI